MSSAFFNCPVFHGCSNDISGFTAEAFSLILGAAKLIKNIIRKTLPHHCFIENIDAEQIRDGVHSAIPPTDIFFILYAQADSLSRKDRPDESGRTFIFYMFLPCLPDVLRYPE